MISAILSERLDKLSIITISTISFVYVNNLISALNNNEYIILDTQNLVFDIVLTYIVTIMLDKTAINDYYNHYYQRKYHFNPKLDTDKSSLSFLFILTISNLIGFYDLKKGL